MMKRRSLFLGAAGAVGALVLGWGVMAPRQRLTTSTPLAVGKEQAALNGWLKIAADNTVTVVMCKSEMGQGTHTGLAMVLAEELDADWATLVIEQSPIDKIYGNLATVVDGLPFHPDDHGTLKDVAGWLTAKTMREVGIMVTGGSSSIKDLWLPMREAGASARAMLVTAAAANWNVLATECTTSAGKVTHPSGKSATYGELAALASQQAMPAKAALKDPANFKLIGQPVRRIEAASKLDGSARFAIDANPPGLLYADVVMCPTLGGSVTSFDSTAAAVLPGVMKVFAVAGHNGGTAGVAAIADTPWHAMRAIKAVTVVWNHGLAATLNTDDVYKQLTQTLDKEAGFAYFKQGDVSAALKAAAKTITADYRAPYVAHATMEPMNCTVQIKNGRATVWAGTQVPSIARSAVAKLVGLKAEQVDVQVPMLGGGFGRRLEVDFIVQAAAIAKEAEGAPVQTLWSREQDMTHDFYRPACVSRFTAGFDAAGKLTAWQNTSAGQAVVPQVLKRTFDLPAGGPDKSTSEGAYDQPYEWPTARVAHETVDLPVPVGFWRSVGHSHHAFFKESFVDEAATAAGQDPVAFRVALLSQHPRHLKVLQRAAELSGWGKPLAAGADGIPRARGVALHQCFGSIVAQVAEVSVTADKAIRVHRVVCVIDCGTPVNPNLIAQQMESGVVFGLSAALYGDITLKAGQVQQSNFHDQAVLRFNECPVIETDIIKSTAHPQGVGEPGTPPIAPAVANALFALTGQRLRSLPLKLA